MKLTFTFLTLLFASSLFAQTFCLKLSEVSNDGSNLVVKIEMSGSTAFELGSSNLQWSYNTAKLSSPTLLSTALPPPPFYSVNVTMPNPGEASLNIDLSLAGVGTTIGDTWTEVAQINYTILDPSDVGELLWLYNGSTTLTVVFIDNETTQIFATSPACLEGILAPLPVELLSFKATPQGEVVALEWETASEENNRGFEVQRSKDALNWEKIGWLASNGHSFNIKQYALTDKNPLDGNNYYRLKIVDLDNSSAYSQVEQVRFEKPIAVKLFPNPAKGVVSINFPAQQQLERVLVYDQVGGTKFEATVLSDNTLDLSSMASGVYFVEMHFAQQVVRKKLILQ